MSDGHERSEPATPKRRERARREGDHPRSSIAPCAFAIAFAAVPAMFGSGFVRSWLDAFGASAIAASQAGAGRIGPMQALGVLTTGAQWAVVVAAWIGGVAAAIGAAGVTGALGWSPEALRPRARGPIIGLRSLVDIEQLTQTASAALAAVAVIAAALPAAIEMTNHIEGTIRATAVVAWQSLCGMWWRTSAALCAIGAVDVVFARRRHASRLRMTPREVRDERAEQEGRPEIRARRRGVALRRARRIRLDAIRRASAIIANPTHVAIALQYAPPAIDVPVVAAAGAEAAAAFIRIMASYHDIPIIESPDLARALFARVDVDDPVPEEYYAAIAAIFAWLLRTRGRLGGSPDR